MQPILLYTILIENARRDKTMISTMGAKIALVYNSFSTISPLGEFGI